MENFEFEHVSVLLSSVIEGLNIRPDGIYVDATMGGAGHSKAILVRLGPKGLLIGIDQDATALRVAAERLSERIDQVRLVKGNFEDVKELILSTGVEKIDGILFDLGVSSYQLDTSERGFSYRMEGPLDMRMDSDGKMTAEKVVNDWTEEGLVKILFEYGEEKFARRIAGRIVKKRQEKRITGTLELAEIIKEAIPAATRRTGPHPAKRSFQAIRIAVNRELEILEKAFQDGIDLLNPGGRIGVITFHSLEDRMTKNIFKKLEKPCVCPPQFPICACGKEPVIRQIGKAQGPSIEELTHNSRARSAKLRLGEKL